MIQQDDLSALSDEELARIAGVTLQAPARQQAATRPQAAYNGPTDAASIMPALIAQESGGRAGVLGPQTRYGRAIGRTQMLPGTAREMASKVGLPFDESLLRGTSPEAAAYQDRLGQAYLEEGLQKTGNVRDALMYYHGGPDRRLWGPKTQAYAGEVLARVGQDQPSMQAAPEPQDDLDGLSDEELMQLAGIAPEEAPQEVEIDQGVMNVNGRAMIGDRDMGPWAEYWASRDQTNADRTRLQPILQEERDNAARYAELGYGPNFASQTTAPLNDELGAIAGFASQGVENLGRRLMGRDIEVSAMDRGRAVAGVAREQQKAFSEENPWQAGIGQALGGFAFAPARAGGAAAAVNGFARPTVGQAYKQAAAIGGGYGVADAEGGVSGRLQGGALGAGLGVATAGLIDGGTRLLPRGRGALQPNENRVADALNRELRSNRMSPQDILSAMNGAPEGTLPLNLGRGALSGAAEVIAQSPGPGRQVVMDALRQQRATSGDRIGRRVQEALGGEGNYFATLDNQITQRRTAANQVIEQIGPQVYRPNENAMSALRSSYAREALTTQASLKADSPDPVIRAQAESLNAAIAALGRDLDPNVMLDVRTAQDVSRALLDSSSEAWRNGNSGVGQLLGDIGKAVRDDARTQVKPYGEWLKRYGDDSSQIEALELGRSVLRNVDDPRPDGVSAEVLRKQVAEMSDTAKDLFRKGVGEAIVARSRTSKGGVGAMRDILRSDELGARLRVAFPDEQAYTRFLNAAEAEAAMGDAANGILGNSRTAFRQGAAQRMGAEDYGQAAELIGASLPGLAIEGVKQGVRSVGKSFGRNRSVLENDDLNELFAKALTDQDLLRQMLQGQRPRRGLFGGRAPAGVAGALPSAVL